MTEPQDGKIKMKTRVTTAQDTESKFTVDIKCALRQGIILKSAMCKNTKSRLISKRMLLQSVMVYYLYYLSLLFLPEKKKLPIIKKGISVLYRKVISVYFENSEKHVNTRRERNVTKQCFSETWAR